MVNSFYTASGIPVTGSPGVSAGPRGEFALIQAGFDKMPTLTAGTAVVVNGGGTALGNTVGTLTLAGNFVTTGAFAVTLAASAIVTITLPGASGTMATLAGTEELTGKTLTASVAKGVWTASGAWTIPAVTIGGAITYGGVALANSVTGTGSMVLSVSPSFTGTLSVSGNARIKSANVASLANNGTLDLDLVTGGAGFAGTLEVCNNQTGNAGFQTLSVFAVVGRLAVLAQATQITGNAGSGGCSFTLTMVSNGVFRVTNTSGAASDVVITFFGHVSA